MYPKDQQKKNQPFKAPHSPVKSFGYFIIDKALITSFFFSLSSLFISLDKHCISVPHHTLIHVNAKQPSYRGNSTTITRCNYTIKKICTCIQSCSRSGWIHLWIWYRLYIKHYLITNVSKQILYQWISGLLREHFIGILSSYIHVRCLLLWLFLW